MTREYFFAYKAQLTNIMNGYLSHSHTVGYPLKDYCIAHSVETITIANDYEDEDELRHLTNRVHDLMARDNTKMTMSGDTYNSGRYDYFSKVNYSFDTIIVKDTLEDYQIEAVMKDYVKKALGLQSYHNLECKVMQLFKDGFIEWAEVVEAHKQESCSL